MSAHELSKASRPLLVVADDNMYYRSMRYQVHHLLTILR